MENTLSTRHSQERKTIGSKRTIRNLKSSNMSHRGGANDGYLRIIRANDVDDFDPNIGKRVPPALLGKSMRLKQVQ